VSEPGYAKGRAKRREIIEQAMAMFGEVGYRGTSLRELAARCGLSHPGLLHHFPTKEGLLQAVLEQRDAEDDAWFGARTDTPLGGLRRLVELVARNAARRGIVELFCVLSAEATAPDHPAHAYFARRYEQALADMRGHYARVREAGLLCDGVEPDLAGCQLVALLDGLQLQWLYDGGATDMESAVRAHVQTHLTVPL
jgi:AcrR family transcriptional regulator